MEVNSSKNETDKLTTEPQMFSIYECFNSLSGEINGFTGIGQLSTFIRFSGCNLKCRWCDTLYANGDITPNMSYEQILNTVELNHVTLTGGEPLLQPITELANELACAHQVTIETNGTQTRPVDLHPNVICIMDYKLPSSQMIEHMDSSSFVSLQSTDWVKFVCQDEFDLSHAMNFISGNKCGTKNFAFSPLIINGDAHSEWQQQLLESIIEYSQLEEFKVFHHFHFSIQIHKLIGVN